MATTKWIKQARYAAPSVEFLVSLKKRGFSLNADLAADIGPNCRFAEILISEDSRQIAFVFHEQETEWSFPVGEPKKGGLRTIDAGDLIKRKRPLSCIAGEQAESATIRVKKQDGMYVGELRKTFCFDGMSEPPSPEAVGVFRAFIGTNIVFIGAGKIKAQIDKCLAEHHPINRYDYFLTQTKDEAFEQLAKILEKYHEEHGAFPFLNRRMMSEKVEHLDAARRSRNPWSSDAQGAGRKLA